jgi:hypothetical protein
MGFIDLFVKQNFSVRDLKTGKTENLKGSFLTNVKVSNKDKPAAHEIEKHLLNLGKRQCNSVVPGNFEIK